MLRGDVPIAPSYVSLKANGGYGYTMARSINLIIVRVLPPTHIPIFNNFRSNVLENLSKINKIDHSNKENPGARLRLVTQELKKCLAATTPYLIGFCMYEKIWKLEQYGQLKGNCNNSTLFFFF